MAASRRLRTTRLRPGFPRAPHSLTGIVVRGRGLPNARPSRTPPTFLVLNSLKAAGGGGGNQLNSLAAANAFTKVDLNALNVLKEFAFPL